MSIFYTLTGIGADFNFGVTFECLLGLDLLLVFHELDIWFGSITVSYIYYVKIVPE